MFYLIFSAQSFELHSVLWNLVELRVAFVWIYSTMNRHRNEQAMKRFKCHSYVKCQMWDILVSIA